MKKIIAFFASFLLFFIFCSDVKADTPVIINEFSSFDSKDWVELYANVNTDISGWILKDSAQTNVATVSGTVRIGPTESSRFYVFENFGNRLNYDKDSIKIFKPGDSTPIDSIIYGPSENDDVCAPGQGQTSGRFENGNALERFAAPGTKGTTNTGAPLAPCPTPAPDPTQSPAPTAAPTAAPTTIPTKSPTPVPTKKPTPWPSATPDPNYKDDASHQADVLGLRDSLAPTDTPKAQSGGGNVPSFPIIAGIFIVVGLGLMGGAGYIAYRKQKQDSSGTISE